MVDKWPCEVFWTFQTAGIVEERDVVGAAYNETEKLGSDLSLSKLKKEKKIDGVTVLSLDSARGVARGRLRVRCNLNPQKAARVAAALETINQIGPCKGKIEVEGIEFARGKGRSYIEDRGEEILKEVDEALGVKS